MNTQEQLQQAYGKFQKGTFLKSPDEAQKRR